MRMTRGETEIMPFRAGDEREIPALVRSVYGENYDRRFYEPSAIARMVDDGLFLVAARRGGRLAGMTGFRAEGSSNRRLFRTYRRMVAPEARGLGLARAMEELGERLLFERDLADAVYAQIEANSPSNRLLAGCGFALTAAEPAAEARAAQTFLFKELEPVRGGLNENGSLTAAYAAADGPLAQRIDAARVGRGLFDALERLCREGKTLELFMPPPSAEDRERLRALGFFRCGVARRWRPDGDSEIFMKVFARAELPAPPLRDERTLALWEAVCRGMERAVL